jgi:hypothetical protein
MDLKPGSRWKSALSSTEVVVVRPPKSAVVLECAGAPVLAATADRPPAPAAAPAGEGSLLGKRYTDEETGLEVLCSKGGAGDLSASGRPLTIKDPK